MDSLIKWEGNQMMRLRFNLFIFVLLMMVGLGVWGESPRVYAQETPPSSATLVKDINTYSTAQPPAGFVTMNGEIYFGADDGIHGTELWKSDGTPGGTVMVKDIYPGAHFSLSPTPQIVPVNNQLFFLAQSPGNWFTLWKSDGTAEGTVMITGSITSTIDGFSADANMNPEPVLYPLPGDDTHPGLLLFGAWHNEGTNEVYYLWKTDGTVAGTEQLMLLPQIPFQKNGFGPHIYGSIIVDHTLCFGYSGHRLSVDVVKSDGTRAGTTVIFSTSSGPSCPDPFDLCAPVATIPSFAELNGTLFFMSMHTNLHGATLWRSNGTNNNVPIKVLHPDLNLEDFPSDLVSTGNLLFFNAYDPATGIELWRSDGTSEGTSLVKDIHPGPANSTLLQMTSLNGLLYFVVDEAGRRTLWKSDGTAEGTIPVHEFHAASSFGFTPSNGALFFSAYTLATGHELWRSDGTSEGTLLVKDLVAGPGSASPSSMRSLAGQLVFAAYNEHHQPMLVLSNGTAEGTQPIYTFGSTEASVSTFLSGNVDFYPLGNLLYFPANDGESGSELWRTDGTAAGTFLLKDIAPGPGSTAIGPVAQLNQTLLFFTASADGRALWKSQGTTASTVLVKEFPGVLQASISQPAAVGAQLFFFVDSADRTELWRTDGAAEGTVLIQQFPPELEPAVEPRLIGVNDSLFFTLRTDNETTGLWKSDAMGASLIHLTTLHAQQLFNANGLLYFVCDYPDYGAELCKSDGTSPGTTLVKDIVPGSSGFSLFTWQSIGSLVYLVIAENIPGEENMYHPTELWRSDGTTQGTFWLSEIAYLRQSDGRPFQGYAPVPSYGYLYFLANGSPSAVWRTDGTPEGTVLSLGEVCLGKPDAYFHGLFASNNTLYIYCTERYQLANLPLSYLWMSDGTPEHTILLSEFRLNAFYPEEQHGIAGQRAYFLGDDGIHGMELWTIPLPYFAPYQRFMPLIQR